MSTTADWKKLRRTLKKLPAKLEKGVVVNSVRAGGVVVRDEVKDKVSKDSGELKKAVKIKKRRERPGKVRFTVYIKKVVLDNTKKSDSKKSKDTKQYAYYLEYGTSKMRAKPFLRPALTAVGQRPVTAARAKFKTELKKKLKQFRR